MSENSSIEWCDHTFNPWTGCTKVSPGCANCYAESWSKRSGIVQWGKGKPRRRTTEANWREPLKWNRDAERRCVSELHSVPAGQPHHFVRPRVFCASLADWLDDEVPIEWLADLLALIASTPYLDWLLLTKRPGNFASRTLEASFLTNHPGGIFAMQWGGWGKIPANVWIGTTVEDQTRADERIPVLLGIPARVRFLSCEPLLGPVDLIGSDHQSSALHPYEDDPKINWVICGGESGPGARPMHPAWARSLSDQCQSAGVPFLFKQWGEWSPRCEDVKAVTHALANDGTSYLMTDIGPDGPRRGEAMRAGHDKADLVCIYRVGKKAAGRVIDGRTWDEFPTLEVRA